MSRENPMFLENEGPVDALHRFSYLLRLIRELLGTDAGDLELTSKGKEGLIFLLASMEDTIRQIANATKEMNKDYLKKER